MARTLLLFLLLLPTLGFLPVTETQVIEGRTLKPLSQKLNPIWWFKNDDEQQLDDGTTDWYMPGKPQWLRKLCWEFRNPLQNFRSYVVGVQDRNYSVTGKAPVMTVQRNDLDPPERGFQWSVISIGPLLLPFVSYSGAKNTWYVGWQPTGFFGAKANGKIAVSVVIVAAAWLLFF
jgi:hypothetical protein